MDTHDSSIQHPRALEVETIARQVLTEGFAERIAQADIGTDWDRLAALGTELAEAILVRFDVAGDTELEAEVHRAAYRVVEEHYQTINPDAPNL